MQAHGVMTGPAAVTGGKQETRCEYQRQASGDYDELAV